MRIIPFTKNRELIYGLLTRAKRFHSPLSTIVKVDVTDLLARLEATQAQGRVVGLQSYLIKATSELLAKRPNLNQHLFHGLLRKVQVDFEEVSCNMVILRRDPTGEAILLPVVLRNSDRMTIDEIETTIRRYQKTPLAELAEVQAIQRAKSRSLLEMKLFSFKCRSDPDFYLRYFGTYGVTCVVKEVDGRVQMTRFRHMASQSRANNAMVFLFAGVAEEPLVVEGRIVPRKVLTTLVTADHFLVDGHDLFHAIQELHDMIENVSLLAPGPALASVG